MNDTINQTVKHCWDDLGCVLPILPKICQVFFDQIQDSIDPDPGTFILSTQEIKIQHVKRQVCYNEHTHTLQSSVLQYEKNLNTHLGELAPLNKTIRIICEETNSYIKMLWKQHKLRSREINTSSFIFEVYPTHECKVQIRTIYSTSWILLMDIFVLLRVSKK